MFRKNEEAVTEWSPENVELCAERQDEILDQAAIMLHDGGRLVYSTCTFAPDENLTRAMLVTVLYRNESKPAADNRHSFTDVEKGAYYENAVSWALQNGVIKGISETEFAPDAPITREQIAAMMHRYAQWKGIDVSSGEDTNILSYSDFDMISEYAIAPLQWAAGTGLFKGRTEITLNPRDNATRAEIAAILNRFLKSNP